MESESLEIAPAARHAQCTIEAAGLPESALNRFGSQLFDVRPELLNRLRTEQPIMASCQFDQTAEKTRLVPIIMIDAGDAVGPQQPRIHVGHLRLQHIQNSDTGTLRQLYPIRRFS